METSAECTRLTCVFDLFKMLIAFHIIVLALCSSRVECPCRMIAAQFRCDCYSLSHIMFVWQDRASGGGGGG